MRLASVILGAVGTVFVVGSVPAQTVGIGATKGGATAQAAAAIVGIPGTGRIKELNSKVSGGVRCIAFDHSPAAIKRTRVLMPGYEPIVIQPSKSLVAVKAPTPIFAYDYMLWANKEVAADVVYKVTKTMYDNEAGLRATSPIWTTHRSATMSKRQPGLPYHPGAVKFYKDVGAWKGAS